MAMRLDVAAWLACVQESANATGGMDQLEPATHRLGALVGVFLIATSIGAAPLAWRIAARVAGIARGEWKQTRVVHWGFVHVVALAGVVIALLFLIGSLWPAHADEPELAPTLLRTTFGVGGGAVLILAFASRLEADGRRALGLAWRGSLRGAIAGWMVYAASVPAIIGLAFVARWLLESVGREFETQTVVKQFLDMNAADVPLVLVLGIAVMPFLEELVFRGFLQPLLVQRVGVVPGIAATSFVFAALHGLSALLPIFGLALVLGGVRQMTGRLFASWAVHALHNAIMFGGLCWLRQHPEFLHQMGLLAWR
jgi:membrane protease YdiL (CAAX protease family)